MKIKLLKSKLENFRDISDTFEFGPGRNVFSGPNGSGKTTLVDASIWCLTGKDSLGKSDFEVKTIKGGQRMEKADHSVFNTYGIDGNVIEFGRVYRDKYVKKRGAERVKEGNETDYFVEGLKISKTKFEQKIAETFGPHFWECSDIRHVAEMHWQKRRDLLMSMIPFDREKPIDSINGFKELLNKRSVEDAKKYADQRKKDVNAKLTALTAKIEERGEDQPESGLSLQDAQKAVVFAGSQVDKIQAKIDAFKSGGNSELIEQLRKLNNDLVKAESEFQGKKQESIKCETKRLADIVYFENQLENQRQDLRDHKDRKEELKDEYLRVRNQKPDGHPCQYYNEECPYFGLEVPADYRERWQKTFKLEKAKKLEEIVARAEDIKKEISRIESIISGLESDKKKLEEIKPDPILKDDRNEEIISIEDKIAKLKTKIDSEKTEIPEELTNSLADAKQKQKEAIEAEAAVKANQGSQTRIEDLTAEKQKFAEELERIEKFQDLYQEFNRKMAEAVEKPLNQMFHPVNFRMFKTLENGNIEEVCDVMDSEGRPYNGALSNGERIQAGITIVRTLQDFYKVESFVFLDNCEALTSDVKLDCQTIELRASDEFETLTKEV